MADKRKFLEVAKAIQHYERMKRGWWSADNTDRDAAHERMKEADTAVREAFADATANVNSRDNAMLIKPDSTWLRAIVRAEGHDISMSLSIGEVGVMRIEPREAQLCGEERVIALTLLLHGEPRDNYRYYVNSITTEVASHDIDWSTSGIPKKGRST